jgi:peptidoglycan/LPS O-acetylase OafA/YrhL
VIQGRFNNLDAFRGIAALLVLLFHTPFINGSKAIFFQNSDIFVDFFFILSGFVICHSYIKKINEDSHFCAFFQNRFARIYPLHITILLGWVGFLLFKELILQVLNIEHDSIFIANDSYAFFLNLILLNAHGFDDHLSWNAPAWSIGAEFYTYLIFFIVVRYFGKAKTPFLAIFILVCAYTYIYIIKPHTLLRTFDLVFLRALGGFFAGVLIFWFSQKISFKFSKLSFTKMTIIEIFFLLAIYLSVTYLASSKNGQLFTFALFALTIFTYSQTSGAVSQVLNKTLFQQLGRLSYSIYLLHVLIITIIANVWEFLQPSSVTLIGNLNAKVYQTDWAALVNLTIIIVTYSLAGISYKLIEHPWQVRLRAKFITK